MRRRLVACMLAAPLLLAASASAQIYTRRGVTGTVEATNVPDDRSYRLTYPGKGTIIHSAGWRGRYSGEFDPIIAEASRAHGVNSDLVHAVIRAESSYDQYAKSSKGARGLMQLMPATAQRFGVMDSYNPRQNIFAGARYLRILLDMFRGDLSPALAGYNAGENAVKRYGGIPPYRETQRYVRKIRGWLGSGRPASYSYAPRGGIPASTAKAGSQKVEPAQPGIYYKFVDGNGVLHVTNKRPPEGITYSMIRALK